MKYRSVPLGEVQTNVLLRNFSCVPSNEKQPTYNKIADYKQIDTFLLERAIVDNQMNVLRTEIILNDNDDVVAFYSLCAGTRQVYRQFRQANHVPVKARNRALPTIEMIYFAVESRYQGIGIGSAVMELVLKRVAEIAIKLGACLFIVDSLRDAEGFYRQFGFDDIGQAHKLNENVYLGMTLSRVLAITD